MVRMPAGLRAGLVGNMDDDTAMALALEEARAAFAEGEVPVGAVVVRDGEVISRGHNRVIAMQDPTAHAEVLAIREASLKRGPRLEGATLYTTLEPCPMCAGAMVLARLHRVVYGCDDPRMGAARTLYTLLADGRLNHRCLVTSGVQSEQAAALMKRFFSSLRNGARASDPRPER